MIRAVLFLTLILVSFRAGAIMFSTQGAPPVAGFLMLHQGGHITLHAGGSIRCHTC
jgi:hypothetical protein